MLQMTPRIRIPVSRFPPIPFFRRREPAINYTDRRMILMALSNQPPALPTDDADLGPLIDSVAELTRVQEDVA